LSAYYNEFDPQKAAWLRELIKRKLIADGEVDERSIEDVLPADVLGFDNATGSPASESGPMLCETQVGVMTEPCGLPVVLASLSAPPGSEKEHSDERHLWPAFFKLVDACRPPVLFGEQVASSHVVGRASGDFDYLRGLSDREELRRISDAWIPAEISRYVQGLPERTRAQEAISKRDADIWSAQRLAAEESGIGIGLFSQMQSAYSRTSIRSGYREHTNEDRCWTMRINGGFNFDLDGDWNSPSLDRIDPNGGYTADNIRVIITALNVMMNKLGSGASLGYCGCYAPENSYSTGERELDALLCRRN